jgi:hypothetical protein
MNIWQDRIRGLRADQRSEDGIVHETSATCTAFAWLALYGMAVAGSLLFGSAQHKHQIVAAAPAELERSK